MVQVQHLDEVLVTPIEVVGELGVGQRGYVDRLDCPVRGNRGRFVDVVPLLQLRAPPAFGEGAR